LWLFLYFENMIVDLSLQSSIFDLFLEE